MTEEILEFITNDELLNSFDFHFNNFAPFSTSPEKNLMISVLLYAVIDYLFSDQTTWEDANHWFFDLKVEDWLYSFENICFTLGIDEKDFRKRLIALRNSPDRVEKAKKLKHLNPAPGNRNKISVNSLYKPRYTYEDAD